MLRRLHCQPGNSGTTIVEMMVASGAVLIMMAALVSAFIGIGNSIRATNEYVTSVCNESRIMDYVARDLRRAVRVKILSGETPIILKDTGTTTYPVSDTNVLAINIPDYYASNIPDNSAGSAYKTSRYSRATLNTSTIYNSSIEPKLNGIVPWADAQMLLNGKPVTRFAPASATSNEVQVRYFRGPRSAVDSTPCFFRAEYPANSETPFSTQEIAERITDNASTTALAVSARNNGQVFRLKSTFRPQYRRIGNTTIGTEAFVDVSTRNRRRD
jgi:hypothetical protein